MSDSVDGLKQRLVGAFVILSLAVIFLPMIFDKPHSEVGNILETVPSRPDYVPVLAQPAKTQALDKHVIERAPAPKPLPNSSHDKRASASATIIESDGSSKVTKEFIKSTRDTSSIGQQAGLSSIEELNPLPAKTSKQPPPSPMQETKAFRNVWMVQLGTFKNIKNAYGLRDMLRKDGFQAHTKKVDNKGTTRVLSGPFVNKKDALRMKKKVDEKYKLKSLVIFFKA